MDCRYISYSDSIELLKDYKPFSTYVCNPYSVMPDSVWSTMTKYCYLQDELYGKGLFKHIFTEINDREWFEFYIYRVPIDFDVLKTRRCKWKQEKN